MNDYRHCGGLREFIETNVGPVPDDEPTRTPEEEYERRADQDMAAREGELRDLAAEREDEE